MHYQRQLVHPNFSSGLRSESAESLRGLLAVQRTEITCFMQPDNVQLILPGDYPSLRFETPKDGQIEKLLLDDIYTEKFLHHRTCLAP